MSRAGPHRRRALRAYRAALRATQPPSDVVLRNEDQPRATPIAPVDLPVAPVAVAPSAIDVDVLRIVNWNTAEERERRRQEATDVMYQMLGVPSPYL